MSQLYSAPPSAAVRRVTTKDLRAFKNAGTRWPMLTAYDATMASIFDEAGIPVLLVGDSAAMVVYGYDSTLPVSTEELLPLVRAVVRGSKRALVVADLPFGTYQESPEQALATAVRFVKEGGAHAVKLEGGAAVIPQISALVTAGIPVMGHLGLTPQSVYQFGGYTVQGRGDAGDIIVADAKALEAAGSFAIVLEVVPAELARRVREAVSIPVIGIGAGVDVDAQVLVWQDMMGLTAGPVPKFVKKYADMRAVMTSAISTWSQEVELGVYPAPEQQYH